MHHFFGQLEGSTKTASCYNYSVVFFPSDLLEGGVVSANTIVDKHSPSSALVRVCESGLYKFAKALIEHGAQVMEIQQQVYNTCISLLI